MSSRARQQLEDVSSNLDERFGSTTPSRKAVNSKKRRSIHRRTHSSGRLVIYIPKESSLKLIEEPMHLHISSNL